MVVTYDLPLIMLSVAIAVVGSHAGLAVMRPEGRLATVDYKERLLFSAIAVGGSIWAMHFIGMQAIVLLVPVSYAILPTFVSALVAMVLTGLGLYLATSGVIQRHACKLGALAMGAGITSMHYMGMDAIRVVCGIENSVFGSFLALSVGVGASWVALRAMTAPSNSQYSKLLSAIFLGVAISGMHYVAIADTRFVFDGVPAVATEPAMNQYYLVSIAAFLAFLLCDLFVFVVLPEPKSTSRFIAGAGPAAPAAVAVSAPAPPVVGDGVSAPSETSQATQVSLATSNGTAIIPLQSLLMAKAEGHYAEVHYVDETSGDVKALFVCESLGRLRERLWPDRFIRVHRSYIVNCDRVSRIDRAGGSTRLHFGVADDIAAPVGRSYLKAVSDHLAAV
ncbi:MAG: MHYT domain-containing protein [Pseudomonadota bacterium]